MPTRNQRSPEAQEYRRWYSSKRWKSLRDFQLHSEPLCRMCRKAGRITAATVADHTKPHRGAAALFWNPDNLQSLCAPCHDTHKQSEERLGYSKEIGADGWPVDGRHPAYQKG